LKNELVPGDLIEVIECRELFVRIEKAELLSCELPPSINGEAYNFQSVFFPRNDNLKYMTVSAGASAT